MVVICLFLVDVSATMTSAAISNTTKKAVQPSTYCCCRSKKKNIPPEARPTIMARNTPRRISSNRLPVRGAETNSCSFPGPPPPNHLDPKVNLPDGVLNVCHELHPAPKPSRCQPSIGDRDPQMPIAGRAVYTARVAKI